MKSDLKRGGFAALVTTTWHFLIHGYSGQAKFFDGQKIVVE
ncbi:hypothetical protein [Paraburkholderia sp. J8-2]|nr:hypothetical protein [Paraburkholderia sp. J8-2]